jgi:hypothetical protein
MKTNPASLLLIAAATVGVAFAAATPVRASAEDQVDQAVVASKAWVNAIDAGKYEDSYDFTCDETRTRFPEDRWVEVLKALRRPWGGVVTRQQLSHVYQPHGVPGLDGECVVVTYKTTFKNLDPATEVVVLKWEDGKWRGAGYRAGPAADANAASSPADNSTTETRTERHLRPEQQQ